MVKLNRSILICIIISVCLKSPLLNAGNTGKISGGVTDLSNNQPLTGANITVLGTDRGAAADQNGEFTILNLPPGLYQLKFSMMGYKSVEVTQIRVSVDLTTPLSVSLEPTVLESDETVTIVARREMVQRDMTGSLSSVSADQIENLPVESIGDVLSLQAGVVKDGNDFHIRGGRAGEVAYWIDGVATTDVFNGRMGIPVENNAVEELQVISGTYNAEYGQAMSGIINIVTKEGSDHYSGQFSAYLGDYVSNDNRFSVLKRVITDTDDQTGAIQTTGVYENPLKQMNPVYNTEFNLSGPLPFFRSRVNFFMSGRYFSNEGYLYGRNWLTPQGIPGDSSLVPMDPYRRGSGHGKLTWQLSSNIKLSYNIFYSDWHKDRYFSKDWKYVPEGRSQSGGTSSSHIIALNHLLSPKTFYEVRLNRFQTDYHSYVYADPYAAPDYLIQVRSDPENGIEGFVFDPLSPEGQAQLEAVRSEGLAFDYIIDPEGHAGYVHPDSLLAPAAYSFYNIGMDQTHNNRSTAYWVAKFDLTSQLNQAHQMKTGFEVRFHELTLDWFQIRPKLSESNEEQLVPFQPTVPDVSTRYHNVYNRRPRELSAYIQDKIELKEVNVNIGVRLDYFDSNHVAPFDASDPNIYFPFKNENRYRDWIEPPPNLSQSEREAYIAGFEEYTPDERRVFMQKKVRSQWAVSPRLGMAYPITDRGVIHFSYGHFFQIPAFQFLYDNPDFKVSSTGGYFVIGNAGLKPQRTVQYEIGLQQQLTQNSVIDATVFYRDVRDWVGTSPLISTPVPSVKYSRYENKDYSNVRGFTLKLEKRRFQNFSARLEYTFSIVEGTYSDPIDAFNAYQDQEEPRLALVPMNWDRRHSLNGSIVYQHSDWTASLIGRFWTGLPYTPSFPQGEIVGGATLIGLRENSERRPNQTIVDLYLKRQIHLKALRFSVFCNIYNLFDQRDETSVYGDTGSAEYTTEIKPEKIGYNPKRIGTVEDYVLQPSWYTAPREIQVGLAIGF
jgi:outer membrane receptor protein involved in Fe transport